MKNLKKPALTAIAATMLATSAIVPSVAQAEISASASIASMYYWRGYDLGQGDPAFSGDIMYTADNGFYTGVWGSSGDAVLGNEYDLFVGYGGESGDFSYDISFWAYFNPSSDVSFGDAEDVVVSLGYGPVAFTLYESTSDSDAPEDGRYYSFDYTAGDFNFLIGNHENRDGNDDDTHIQIGYSYNDNLSFIVSKFLDDDDGRVEDDVQFVVRYSLDIK